MSLSKENKTTLAIAGAAVGAAALAGLGYYLYRNSSGSKGKGGKQGKALPPNSVSVTCTAPVNIAVIKYWGKRDDEVSKKLIIPVNSSLSATIDQDSMCSTTTITATKSDKTTYSMCLNGKEESVYDNKRLLAVINAMIPIAKAFTTDDGKEVVGAADWPHYSLRIESVNNFPTAAGLASSASGYACLTFTLAALFGVAGPETDHANREWLSTYARQGSGSACRSLEGGFVQWIKGGDAKDGSDSIARQVVSQAHWPDIRILILVVNASKKETSSTDGMQESVRTSDFLKYRAATQVPERMKAMITALEQRDFHAFADLTMRDSNSFHSVCLDTLPPITYMNATSHRIAAMVHAVNRAAGAKHIAAYTYDAGPNAVVFTTAQHMDTLLATFKHYFAPSFGAADFVFDPLGLHDAKRADAAAGAAWVKAIGEKNAAKDQIKQIIVSRPGPGPKVIAKAQNIVAVPAAAAGAGAGAKK